MIHYSSVVLEFNTALLNQTLVVKYEMKDGASLRTIIQSLFLEACQLVVFALNN